MEQLKIFLKLLSCFRYKNCSYSLLINLMHIMISLDLH